MSQKVMAFRVDQRGEYKAAGPGRLFGPREGKQIGKICLTTPLIFDEGRRHHALCDRYSVRFFRRAV
jgi:hypothetical protein